MLLVKSLKSWFDFSFDVSSKLSKTSGLLLKVNTVPITEKKNIYKKNCKNLRSFFLTLSLLDDKLFSDLFFLGSIESVCLP